MNKMIKYPLMLSLAIAATVAYGQKRDARLSAQRARRPPAVSRSVARQEAVAIPKDIDDELKKIPRGTNGIPTQVWFDQAPIELLIYAYAEVTGRIPIIEPNLPKAQITLKSFKDRSLTKEQYLNAIERVLTENGVVLMNADDIFLYVLDGKGVCGKGIRIEQEQIFPLSEKGLVISQLILLKHIATEEAQKIVEGFKAPEGQIMLFERNNSMIITDTQENVNRMLQIIHMLDVPLEVRDSVFERQINFAMADVIKAALESIVTESQKSINPAQSGPKTSGAPGFASAHQSSPVSSRLLNNRAGQTQPAVPVSNAPKTAQVSDADRGMIRGKVLIISDERSNKLIIITEKANMDFFDKVIEMLDVKTTPEEVVEVRRLKYADAEEVAKMLNELIGTKGSSTTKSNPNGKQGKDAGGNGNLTQKNGSTQPKKASKTQVFGGVGDLDKDNTTIIADKRINGLVIKSRQANIVAIRDLIDDMDVKLSQVIIEVAIVQVELGDDIQTGIDWVQRNYEKMSEKGKGGAGGGGGGTNSSDLKTMAASVAADAAASVASNAVASVVAASPIGSGINYMFMSKKLNLSAVLKATQSGSRTKVVASPIIMTIDNKEASVEATDIIYLFSGYQQVTSAYTATQVRNYEKRDIGLTLKVTPHINPNGTVVLTVNQKFETRGQDQAVPNNNDGYDLYPTVTTRTIASDISVDNNTTIVMGGLTKTTTTDSETGVPILKDIPVFGKWLFGSVTKSEARSELLVFLTPRVIDDGVAAMREAKRRWDDIDPYTVVPGTQSPIFPQMSLRERLLRLKRQLRHLDEERDAAKAIDEVWKTRLQKLQQDIKDVENKASAEWGEAHKEEIDKINQHGQMQSDKAILMPALNAVHEQSSKKVEVGQKHGGSPTSDCR